jgi:hypothetical protein
MAEAGDVFTTGEKAPVSGVYEYARHVESMTPFTCAVPPEERQITLDKGDVFPDHIECKQGLVWKLVRKT